MGATFRADVTDEVGGSGGLQSGWAFNKAWKASQAGHRSLTNRSSPSNPIILANRTILTDLHKLNELVSIKAEFGRPTGLGVCGRSLVSPTYQGKGVGGIGVGGRLRVLEAL